MMAKGGVKKMSTQALANKPKVAVAMQGQALAAHPHQPHIMRGQAAAVEGRRHHKAQALASGARNHYVLSQQAHARAEHKMLRSRIQALAEVQHFEGEGAGSEQDTAVQAALKDVRSAKLRVQLFQTKVYTTPSIHICMYACC